MMKKIKGSLVYKKQHYMHVYIFGRREDNFWEQKKVIFKQMLVLSPCYYFQIKGSRISTWLHSTPKVTLPLCVLSASTLLDLSLPEACDDVQHTTLLPILTTRWRRNRRSTAGAKVNSDAYIHTRPDTRPGVPWCATSSQRYTGGPHMYTSLCRVPFPFLHAMQERYLASESPFPSGLKVPREKHTAKNNGTLQTLLALLFKTSTYAHKRMYNTIKTSTGQHSSHNMILFLHNVEDIYSTN